MERKTRNSLNVMLLAFQEIKTSSLPFLMKLGTKLRMSQVRVLAQNEVVRSGRLIYFVIHNGHC